MNHLEHPSTSKGISTSFDSNIEDDILEYVFDSGSEIDDEEKDPDYKFEDCQSSDDETIIYSDNEIDIDPPQAKKPRQSSGTTKKNNSATKVGGQISGQDPGWRLADTTGGQAVNLPPFTAQPGVNLASPVSTPFEAFKLFFTDETFKNIKTETNRYARSIIDREVKKRTSPTPWHS
ncbi:PGBD5 [Cordylochernes scorpioides]|uniref:PGBD5 n=1 Tax=Cordylochernes scorpioides TaxID=51811 RepID=A0ABY6LC86_9ARAC|nr:PGBD5 [Cordylochernes scorpioides]